MHKHSDYSRGIYLFCYRNQGGVQNANPGYEYGYPTSVYSTPSTNYNTAYQREKQQFNNGTSGSAGGGGGGNSGTPSNTVIVANVRKVFFLILL